MPRPRVPTLLLLLAALASACTGASTGENSPGATVVVDADRPPDGVEQGYTCRFNGSLAVDDRDDTTFLVQAFLDAPCSRYRVDATGVEKSLLAVRPDGRVQTVADMSLRQDANVLFPTGLVAVMSSPVTDGDGTPLGGPDDFPVRTWIDFFEAGSLQPLFRTFWRARFHRPQLSASRRLLSVFADGSPPSILALAGVAEPADLGGSIASLPEDVGHLQLNWLNHSDRLIGAWFRSGNTPGDSSVRIRTWTVAEKSASRPDLSLEDHLDLSLTGIGEDVLVALRPIAVSPDDRYAVLPLRRYTGSSLEDFRYQLLVVDLDSGALRVVDDARGPVVITPDSSTIVSYRYREPTVPRLVAIDLESLDEEELEIPGIASPQFLVTRTGNTVVLASSTGNGEVVVYDLDAPAVTRLDGLRSDLQELVTLPERGEMWLIERGLVAVDLVAPRYDKLDLDWRPWHVNRLAQSGRLVLDDVQGGRLLFFDPALRHVSGEASLVDAGLPDRVSARTVPIADDFPQR